MLTEEHKNELLEQRDNKLSERAKLKANSPKIRWESDLIALENKLNEMEESDQQEEKANQEIYPADDGIKINFKITEEILKKREKIEAAQKTAAKARPKSSTTLMLIYGATDFSFFCALIDNFSLIMSIFRCDECGSAKSTKETKGT